MWLSGKILIVDEIERLKGFNWRSRDNCVAPAAVPDIPNELERGISRPSIFLLTLVVPSSVFMQSVQCITPFGHLGHVVFILLRSPPSVFNFFPREKFTLPSIQQRVDENSSFTPANAAKSSVVEKSFKISSHKMACDIRVFRKENCAINSFHCVQN